jgi:protein-tyrosine-phosphatase
MPPTRKLRVLYVCIGNACRSPMAEAITRHHAPELFEPSSAGISPLGYLTPLTVNTLLANRYSVEGLTSKPLTREALRYADLIINMSGGPIDRHFDGTPPELADHQLDHTVEDWNVEDPYGQVPATYQRILEEIESRVLLLAGRLRAQQQAANP